MTSCSFICRYLAPKTEHSPFSGDGVVDDLSARELILIGVGPEVGDRSPQSSKRLVCKRKGFQRRAGVVKTQSFVPPICISMTTFLSYIVNRHSISERLATVLFSKETPASWNGCIYTVDSQVRLSARKSS